MSDRILSRVVPSVAPWNGSSARVAREFEHAVASGARLVAAGSARSRPQVLLQRGYTPKHKLELFDATYYLTNPRQNEDIRFYLGYVRLAGEARIYPRIFYKDLSLTWRSASHYVRSDEENWIGKGDVKTVVENGEARVGSDEGTTDLPLEIQTALETLSRRARRIRYDDAAVGLVLRRGPNDRIEPYRDFTAPRRRAAANPRNLVNRGQAIARFTRKNDPTSLRFTRGFEPDFARGVVERGKSTSRLYGGRLERYRIVSRNRRAQYLFIAGPRQVWIASCQATTTQLMSYGVRTIDAVVADELLIPGYEYHFVDEDAHSPTLHSQVPPGFAGAPSEIDAFRVDTSAWLDQLPVIRQFRRVFGAEPGAAQPSTSSTSR